MNRGNNFRGNRRGGRGRGRGGFRGRGRGGNREKGGFQSNFHIQPEKLCETEACITEYISSCEGFSGVLKSCYSDFHVNEINLNKEVGVITNQQIPEAFKLKKLEKPPTETPMAQISQEKWDAILVMLESKDEVKVELDVTEFTKDQRSEVHQQLKDIFREKIVSSTVVDGESKTIQLQKFSKNASMRNQSVQWPKECGEYVHFLLSKENLDTMDAVMKLGNVLHIKSSAFNYAGVKDRRAKTTQWLSLRKVEPWKLLFKTKCYKNMHVGNITFKDKPLKLGQLWGNRFKIALRNVTADETLINTALESLKEKGFINYYGLQRFGNDKEVPTFKIGIKLLQGNFKEAVNLILKPKKCENPTLDITLAKIIYEESGNAKKACEKLNRHTSCIESTLLQALAKHASTDYVTALEAVPRNTRLLYIHSYQSLVWNEVVSKRIKQFGLLPIVGDLVLIEEDNADQMETNSTVESNCNEQSKDKEEVENKTDKSEKESMNTETATDLNAEEKINETETIVAENEETEEMTDNPPKVKILTEDDLKNYTIFDIVLPLPGHNVIYPNNEIKKIYEDILARHGFRLEMPKQKVKSYSLSGNYRKLIELPQDLEWKCIKYNQPRDLLIRSDFEEMIKIKEPEDPKDGKFNSLVVKFNLVSSSYATMALREILKIDTSTQTHIKLNKYHETPNTEPAKEVTSNSLLTDKDKFEAFKMAVFGDNEVEDEENSSKRKIDEVETVVFKKMKVEDEKKKDEGIKTQASLV